MLTSTVRLSGSVFKVERGAAGETDRVCPHLLRRNQRARPAAFRPGVSKSGPPQVTAIGVFENGSTDRAADRDCRSDRQALGSRRDPNRRRGRIGAVAAPGIFAPPTLESVVAPTRRDDKHALHVALAQLGEQGPPDQPAAGRCAGRAVRLALRGGAERGHPGNAGRRLRPRGRVRGDHADLYRAAGGTGAAVETLGRFRQSVPRHGRVADRAGSESTRSRPKVDVKSIPLYIFKTVDEFRDSIEATVQATLEQGLLGWQVTAWRVTLTDCRLCPSPSSTAADFRKLAPLVLMSARRLRNRGLRADSRVPARRPGGRTSVDVPRTRAVACRSTDILRCRARRSRSQARSRQLGCTLLQRQLRSLTHGEGVLEFEFALPAGQGRCPDAIASRPQPAQPEGVSAARDAAGTRGSIVPFSRSSIGRARVPHQPRVEARVSPSDTTRPRRRTSGGRLPPKGRDGCVPRLELRSSCCWRHLPSQARQAPSSQRRAAPSTSTSQPTSTTRTRRSAISRPAGSSSTRRASSSSTTRMRTVLARANSFPRRRPGSRRSRTTARRTTSRFRPASRSSRTVSR